MRMYMTCLFACTLAGPVLAQDRVDLKEGGSLTGTVLSSSTKDTLQVRDARGFVWRVPANQVTSITKAEQRVEVAASAAPAAAEQRSVPAQPAPATAVKQVPAQPTGGSSSGRVISRREGFNFGFGLGYGSGGAGCSGCSGDRYPGLSGWLSAGGTLSPSILLGAESNGYYRSEDGVTEQIGALTLSLTAYPVKKGNFFVTAGIGGVYYGANVDGYGSESTAGFGGRLGVGYDIEIGRRTSLTPKLQYFSNVGGADLSNFGLNGSANFNVLQLGLGMTFH